MFAHWNMEGNPLNACGHLVPRARFNNHEVFFHFSVIFLDCVNFNSSIREQKCQKNNRVRLERAGHLLFSPNGVSFASPTHSNIYSARSYGGRLFYTAILETRNKKGTLAICSRDRTIESTEVHPEFILELSREFPEQKCKPWMRWNELYKNCLHIWCKNNNGSPHQFGLSLKISLF